MRSTLIRRWLRSHRRAPLQSSNTCRCGLACVAGEGRPRTSFLCVSQGDLYSRIDFYYTDLLGVSASAPTPALQVMHGKVDFSGDVCIDHSLVASDVYASNLYKIDWRNAELTEPAIRLPKTSVSVRFGIAQKPRFRFRFRLP